MSTIVEIEYIGARRDPNYAKTIGCVEGTRELSQTFNKAIIKKVTGKDRDKIDDIKSFEPVEVRVPVPLGKSLKINSIQYNFIPETDYRCEVSDPMAIGRLLSFPDLFRKVEVKAMQQSQLQAKKVMRRKPYGAKPKPRKVTKPAEQSPAEQSPAEQSLRSKAKKFSVINNLGAYATKNMKKPAEWTSQQAALRNEAKGENDE